MSRVGRWWERRVDGTVEWLGNLADSGGVVPRASRAVFGTNVDRQLVPGEHVIDEVRHIWVAFVWPSLILAFSVLLGIWSLATVPIASLWLPLLLWLVLFAFGTDQFIRAWKDRFIITDSRVMRISGVYNRKAAWMPLARVLDITVERPLWLRPLRSGHLVLENAAQEQGLREIRLIPHPNDRALLIHALRTGVGPETEVHVKPAKPLPGDHPATETVRRRGHHLR